MSGLDRLLILSPRAEDDFADIFQYSLETWGEAQAYAYPDILDQALLTIQVNPLSATAARNSLPSIGYSPRGGTSSYTASPPGQSWYPASCMGAWISAVTTTFRPLPLDRVAA